MIPNLHDAIAIFLKDTETKRQKSPSTITTYRNTLNRFEAVMTDWGVTDLQDMTYELHAIDFHDELVDQGLASNTIKTYIMTIRSFFTYAVKRNWMEANPFAPIEVKAGRRHKPTVLTRDQFAELLHHAPNATLYNIFLVGGDAGLRISETLALRCKDIDLEANTLYVDRGKGNKSRTIPMTHRLATSLRTYMKSERRNDFPNVEELFMMPSGTSVRPNYVNDHLRKTALDRFSFPLTSHALRHTFATTLHQAKAEIAAISHLLGHNSIQTTEQYLHISEDESKQTINLLND